jgi:hypothetical protein
VSNTHDTQEFRLSTPDKWRTRGMLGVYCEDFEIADNMNFVYKNVPSCTPQIIDVARVEKFRRGLNFPEVPLCLLNLVRIITRYCVVDSCPPASLKRDGTIPSILCSVESGRATTAACTP